MRNIKLIIAYDGGAYLGWQKTRMGPSIEQALQEVLEQIFQHKIKLQAASRTDAGVHAEGQVVNFFTDKENFCLNRLKTSLNGLLPKDIAVIEAESVPINFHPTLDCLNKEYHYSLCYGSVQIPRYRHTSWHYPYKLDLAKMHEGASLLTGNQNFEAFCNFKKNHHYTTYLRNLESIVIFEKPQKQLLIAFRGTNFLYKMVRNLVGTLVYVAKGKIELAMLPSIILSCDRTKAGMTAPSHGLCLKSISY